MKKPITIVKIGGNIIDDPKALKQFLKNFSSIPSPKILVHGGGKLATELSSKLGIKTQMVEGRRITDAETLKVTTMVYAGWINKSITASLNAKNKNAIGLCGADISIIPSTIRKKGKIDYGFVGDVVPGKTNSKAIKRFLKQGMVPVIAPITSDKKGQLLNTNADTIASSLAIGLSKTSKVKLVYCFEKPGVLNGKKVISSIDPGDYIKLKNRNIINGGMIPKLDNAFSAAQNGVKEVIIGNANKLNKLLKANAGTRITYPK
jgi:acetylglutamate kinase